MTVDQSDSTIVSQTPVLVGVPETIELARTTGPGPGPSEIVRRAIYLVFGLIQIVIGARIVLLLLDAREANGLVSWILSVSTAFVAPFDGILRQDSLHAAGSVLDITAIVAIVGWTLLEMIVLWIVTMFRRDTV
jgi:hypothetical protein